ncbi:MAG: hypothetical protein IPH13_20180 [Planctomycetes bacterium]|nr:hypothetical protein [Planctomycetota bacterium]
MLTVREARAQIAQLESEAAHHKFYRDWCQVRIDAADACEKWMLHGTENGWVIERNTTSRAHHLLEALARVGDDGDPKITYAELRRASVHKLAIARFKQTAGDVSELATDPSIQSADLMAAQVFVLQHDWSAALGSAIDAPTESIALPAPSCLFEFQVNGRWVLLHATQSEGENPKYAIFLHHEGVWFDWGKLDIEQLRSGGDRSLGLAVWRQVVAVCIVLDSEIAERVVVRADTALQKARARAGRPPIRPYYVVDLSRRRRTTNENARTQSTDRHVRLHFRRGHWRHYDGFKTWIRWTLVGDPDLGFVDKHYRL